MLGWFKKKFGKKEAPKQEEVGIEELTEEAPPSPPVEVEAPVEIVEPVQKKYEVPIPESTPEPVAKKEEESPAQKPTVTLEVPTTEETTSGDVEEASVYTDATVKQVELEKAESEEVEIQKPEKTPVLVEKQEEQPPEPEVSQQEKEQNVAVEEKEETSEKTESKRSLFSRLSSRLEKTKESLTYQMDALFLGKKEIDTNLLDSLEEILITADLGVETADELITFAKKKVKRKELTDPNSLKKIIKEHICKYILDNEADATLVMPQKGPFVIMVIGVNGVGKTTTIGKITHKFKQSGQSVMLVAADTFRAAAVSQLKIWGERNGVPVVAHHEGADPSSVVFDAVESAVAKDVDVVIVDTAGRMHTKDNLMEELKKIKRVMGKKLRGAPHEVLLVIDATTGQNGISQARLFDAAVDVTGLALTKLDGTSKGGIIVNISRDMKIPIRFIGIGEQLDDLRDFDATEFVDALFQSDK